MAITRAKVVKEDLETGHGVVTVGLPGGDQTGNKIGIHTFNSVVNIKDFGAVGDDSANDTTAVQNALDAGADSVYVPDGTFQCGAITIPVEVKRLFGPGTLKQRAAGTDMISITSSTRLVIEGLTIAGVSGTVSASGNIGITATSCSYLHIKGCRFTGWRFNAIQLTATTDSQITENAASSLSNNLVSCQGVQRVIISSNLVKDTQLAALSTAIQLESTHGHSNGTCRDVVISNNHISGYPRGQAIMCHTAERVTITGNQLSNNLHGVYVAPAGVGGSSDIVDDVTIVGNSIQGNASGGASGDGSGGVLAAGGSSSSVKNITISGNSISKINYANKHNNQAAIMVHYCVGVTVTGNAIEDTYGVGIRLQQNCVHVLISDNHIKNILATTDTTEIGIHIPSTGTVSGRITNNVIDGCANGIRCDVTSAPDLVAEDNQFFSTTNNYVGTGFVVEGKGIYTAADTTPTVAHNVKHLHIANGSSCVITQFDNAQDGQILHLTFADTNTTINRTNAYLQSGTNYVSSVYGTLTLVNRGGKWYEVARVAQGSLTGANS